MDGAPPRHRRPGPAPALLGIIEDSQALRDDSLDNLRTFWQHHAGDMRAQLEGVPDEEPIDAETLVWAMLGPARLHYTLTGGDIVSKSGAAAHIARYFRAGPTWRIVRPGRVRGSRSEQRWPTCAKLLTA